MLRRPEVKLALRRLIALLRLLAPTRRHVVVTGFPDDEGNAVEVVRALVDKGARVCWLVDSLPRERAVRLLGTDPGERLRMLSKRSVAGFAAYLTAGLTFFTHGLYLSPVPPRRKPVVNLWHGDGPKAPLSDRNNIRPRASALVSGTRLFGEIKAGFLQVPLDHLLVVGNPRCDQLRQPVTDVELTRLGLEAAKPFVLYMPTFRSSIAVGSRVAWRDAAQGADTAALLEGLVAGAVEAGAQLVVKPHPLDAEEYDVPGAVVVTNADLAAAEVPLYRLLGRAAGLVTDYSSVWTDFLVLDRPIGFVLNDLNEYARGNRGLNVDNLTDLLPGPVLTSAAECAGFVADAVHDPASSRAQRERAAQRIGLARPAGGTAAALLAALDDSGLLRRWPSAAAK